MLANAIATIAQPAVAEPIRDAARATGTSFEYLLTTARVESGLNPKASAATSSARGLFQFIDQTWLATLKQAGAALGYGRYADAIVQTPTGRFEVPDPAARHDILALRGDASASAAMAGAFTSANAARLAERLGRPASNGELYIAHFLGSAGAAKLISTAATNPGTSASAIFPGAAAANRPIFYNRDGSARTASEVYGVLIGRYDAARGATAVAMASPAPVAAMSTDAASAVMLSSSAKAAMVTPTESPTAQPVDSGAATLFHGLFSDERREAVSPIVRDLWATRPQVAAALTGVAVPPTASTGGRLDLFRDLPSDARALFGSQS